MHHTAMNGSSADQPVAEGRSSGRERQIRAMRIVVLCLVVWQCGAMAAALPDMLAVVGAGDVSMTQGLGVFASTFLLLPAGVQIARRRHPLVLASAAFLIGAFTAFGWCPRLLVTAMCVALCVVGFAWHARRTDRASA